MTTESLRDVLVLASVALLGHLAGFSAYSGDMSGKSLGKLIENSGDLEPWERKSVDYGVSYLFRISNVTPVDYQVLSSVISVKTPIIHRWKFEDGDLILRTRIDLIADYIIEGVENYYFGFSGSPSLEWWNKRRDYSTFFSIGGGAGLVDATSAVVGGQGQDFTFNWFVHVGARHRINEHLMFHYGVFFHHLSNLNLAPVNPGLNTIGPMIGFTYEF